MKSDLSDTVPFKPIARWYRKSYFYESRNPEAKVKLIEVLKDDQERDTDILGFDCLHNGKKVVLTREEIKAIVMDNTLRHCSHIWPFIVATKVSDIIFERMLVEIRLKRSSVTSQ